MTKIKICGLTRDEDVDYVNILRPDFVGFVFASRSRRYVSPERATTLRTRLRLDVPSVGVFVNAPLDTVVTLVERQTINFVQLHGAEDNAYLDMLRTYVDVPLIQAFSVTTSDDLKRAEDSRADFVLLDNGVGGTGKTFNWAVVQSFSRPFFLAGGLNADNITQAIELLDPFAVDVSSGVESGGIKDFDKIREIVFRVRNHKRPI